MRIVILGPVTTPKHFGGVATFDEGIATCFQSMGHNVWILSHQKEQPINSHLNILSGSWHSMAVKIKEINPDLVIASLQYGMLFSKKMPGIKVLFLHGFFNFAFYGVMKALSAVFLSKYMAKKSDYTFANSTFTAAINQTIWGIKVDNIVNIGVDDDYLRQVREHELISNASNGVILFAGRLVPGKGVDRIIHAVAEINRGGEAYTLRIVGDGPERSRLELLASEVGCPVEFTGKRLHNEMYDVFRNAEVFVSLHETESYGIAYIEALLAGCKIVCPNTGGQIAYLINHLDRTFMTNGRGKEELAKCILQAIKAKPHDIQTSKLIDVYSYKTACKSFLDYLGKERNS